MLGLRPFAWNRSNIKKFDISIGTESGEEEEDGEVDDEDDDEDDDEG